MTKKIDLNRYQEFVDNVTSSPSKDLEAFIERVRVLDAAGMDVPRALTAGIGLASECGELDEIIKKIVFHGKEYNADNVFHMKRELGDIIWYWTNACKALGLDPDEVIAENITKLESRYPGGKFDVWHSENRKEGDI
jgi:NTP pyrophosphatase (non-canonical NTP hydrolase)